MLVASIFPFFNNVLKAILLVYLILDRTVNSNKIPIMVEILLLPYTSFQQKTEEIQRTGQQTTHKLLCCQAYLC